MLENLREKLSRSDISLMQWVIAFSCILLVRFFLESISSPSSSGIIASDAPTLVHYYLFFGSVILALMLVFQRALPSWKKAIPFLSLFILSIVLLPPVIDWLISAGRGLPMSYLIQSPTAIIYSFLTFFGPSLFSGITIGMRIEVAILIVGTGRLVWSVDKRLWKSILTALSVYVIIFVAVSLPGIISALAHLVGLNALGPNQFLQSVITHSATLADNIHSTLRYATLTRLLEIGFDFLMGRIWFLIMVILGWVWFLTNFEKQTKAIIRNSRPERVAHYVVLIFLGLLVAYRQAHFHMTGYDVLTLLALVLAFYFSWMSAVCVNDLADVGIDQVSNSRRPLPSNSVSLTEMKSAGFLFFGLALISGFLSGYYAFFCVLAFNALYYIYSAPPTRFKRIPFLSALIVALCCLTVALAGFFTFSQSKILLDFSPLFVGGVVSVFFLSQHVKDLKDIDGDRAEGITTIPTFFGAFWGSRIVAGMVSVAYLIIPLFFGRPLLFVGSIPAALVSYWVITNKNYKEKYVFVVYFVFALFLLCMYL